MSVEERLRQQGVKVNGTLDIRAGFKFLSRAFVDEYGVIINFKFPEDEQEGGGGGSWCGKSAAGEPVIMGQGALNQGVSKTEMPGKSQMSVTYPQQCPRSGFHGRTKVFFSRLIERNFLPYSPHTGVLYIY